MISTEIQDALNRQINQEFAAAFNYLAMAAHFESQSLDGFARWMQVQHTEELQHAMRLYHYLLDRGGRLELDAIPRPKATFDSVKEVFTAALDQEQKNTASINELYKLATGKNDHATMSHLQWFIDEQVEEEKSIEDILGLLDLAEGDRSALLYLNDKLGSRTAPAEPPAASA